MAKDHQYRSASDSYEPGAHPAHSPLQDERSVGQLVKELAHETQTLIRQEFQLAKAEATEKASQAGRGLGFALAGGFVAYAGFLAVVAALGFLLGSFMPNWIGFLVAGLVVLLTGYALAKKGLNSLRSTNFSFDRTAETLQEDTLWMKQEGQEVKRDPKHLGTQR